MDSEGPLYYSRWLVILPVPLVSQQAETFVATSLIEMIGRVAIKEGIIARV
jgi:hypothetical protein